MVMVFFNHLIKRGAAILTLTPLFKMVSAAKRSTTSLVSLLSILWRWFYNIHWAKACVFWQQYTTFYIKNENVVSANLEVLFTDNLHTWEYHLIAIGSHYFQTALNIGHVGWFAPSAFAATAYNNIATNKFFKRIYGYFHNS